MSNNAVKLHVLESITLENYDIDDSKMSDKQKLQKVAEIFLKEYGHELKRYKNIQRTIKEWLMGLPSVCTVHFSNYDILQFGVKHHNLNLNSDWLCGNYLDRWFDLCAEVIREAIPSKKLYLYMTDLYNNKAL